MVSVGPTSSKNATLLDTACKICFMVLDAVGSGLRSPFPMRFLFFSRIRQPAPIFSKSSHSSCGKKVDGS